MDSTSHDHQELLKGQAHIWNHMFNFINSMSLKCAVELAIPDAIHSHGSAMTLPDLATKLPIHPSKTPHLHRLMRALTHSGFFEVQGQGGYALTPSSRLLLNDNPFSVAPFVLALLDPCMTSPFRRMSAWFRNDATAFETANGVSFWEYGAREPEFGGLFNEAMASDTSLVASVVAGSCKGVFEGVRTLVDVGGGTGTMVRALLDPFPNMECTVFDLPHVVEGLEGSKNLKFLGGDMFQGVPPANAILLKSILHDWSDENCLTILKKCKESIASSGGKVIIIDIVMENHSKDNNESYETQLLCDMEMMALVSGKERDENGWANLFSIAGFSDYKITPILGLRSLIILSP